MPVNSKKQGQGQTGKKGDDAKTKASKASGNEANGVGKDLASKSKTSKK